ncbi:MAG: MgtC family magnesium (Mg2+) transporter [Candidatus Nomurabacteria bacterium GW2011_GWB1_37_5]|uniref:MgtC family magnesium (Mg2+) transporter n=1 Tax=Candidatus Nomurabacteria bacterium GW2011_GWB1_37_5 TaxID=1618742 RepID=A0A0G0GZ80_9BACT|nr:MAG: MgtC family magnesium (Mg2+) transporter [Candidatus Nomurabacteria bacterium GW2011_GWB1_37_5]
MYKPGVIINQPGFCLPSLIGYDILYYMENIFTPENYELFVKLFIALVLGMIIGIERVLAHKTAGMRTYAMVSMGAALFVIIGNLVGEKLTGFSSFDPLRMASQIVVGIGFLGAGMIVFQESRLIGLTTASGLWVAAGIGMASGFGLYNLAVITTILAIFIFTVLWIVEQWIKKIPIRKIGENK